MELVATSSFYSAAKRPALTLPNVSEPVSTDAEAEGPDTLALKHFIPPAM